MTVVQFHPASPNQGRTSEGYPLLQREQHPSLNHLPRFNDSRTRDSTRDRIETLVVSLSGGLFFGMFAWVLMHAFD